MDEKQKHYFSEEGRKERVAKMNKRIAEAEAARANMTDKQKLAELKEELKIQKDFIKGLKKEHKSTLSKMKKSCQTKTKKRNEEMKKLSKKCEENIDSTIHKFQREIDEYTDDLDGIIDEMHKLKNKK
jgi:predicted  nucleic acid-binding Zn-ribbon protein